MPSGPGISASTSGARHLWCITQFIATCGAHIVGLRQTYHPQPRANLRNSFTRWVAAHVARSDAGEARGPQPKIAERTPAYKSALQIMIEERGHVCLFVPKFHCELNFIERHWSRCKKYTRDHCNYTMQGLRGAMPRAFDSISLTTLRKYSRLAWRYMCAYRIGFTGALADFAVKKYAGHRMFSETLDEKMEAIREEQLAQEVWDKTVEADLDD